jgi:hypothetical protein
MAPSELNALRFEFDQVQGELRAERARVERFRAAIAQHLGKGCRSQSLRTLLAEEDDRDSL